MYGQHHPIGDVMVSVLASSAEYRGFEHRSGHTETLWRKRKDWSARNHNNVSKWNDTCLSKTNGHHHHITEN